MTEGTLHDRSRAKPSLWAASLCAHVLLALALRAVPLRESRSLMRPDARPVELDFDAPPPPPPPPPPAPEVVAPVQPPTPAPTPAARVEQPTVRRATNTPTAVEPIVEPVAPPAPAVTPPVVPVVVPRPVPRAADLLRASRDLAVTGASEGWLAPVAAPAPNRNIYGGSTNHEPPSPERLREIANAPVRAALAETVRDHRPAGAGAHDTFVARRALEADPVREVPGLGAAVRRAPVVTIAGVQRSVSSGEAAVAQNFDQAQGVSFAGMTMGTRMPDLSYRSLRAEIDVDQDASGAVRAVRVSHPSGLHTLDLAAERWIRQALQEAHTEHPWSAGGSRFSRWRVEISEASTGPSFVSGNDGWTVLGNESDGTRVRWRVRMISQRVSADAGA